MGSPPQVSCEFGGGEALSMSNRKKKEENEVNTINQNLQILTKKIADMREMKSALEWTAFAESKLHA